MLPRATTANVRGPVADAPRPACSCGSTSYGNVPSSDAPSEEHNRLMLTPLPRHIFFPTVVQTKGR